MMERNLDAVQWGARGAQQVAVIGAGWAGLAAAVHAVERGYQVTLYEMAAHAGGRARTVARDGYALDNGQHIMIGAYSETLRLMRTVGADVDSLLYRSPLALVRPDGSGLRLPPGPAVLAFLQGVARYRGLSWRAKLSLLTLTSRWVRQRFQTDPQYTVADLVRGSAPEILRDLVGPLCVAALNTPAEAASAQVFLNVLRDGLFGPRGSSDLLLPRAPLGRLLPEPALQWLQTQGATLHLSSRVRDIQAAGTGWAVNGVRYNRVVLATPPAEAARLVQPHAPAWAEAAAALSYEPIVTTYLMAPNARWPMPMLAFEATDEAPAQFGFDLAALGGPKDVYALVISGAAAWVERGFNATGEAITRQLRAAFGSDAWPDKVDVLQVRAEKRATFACTPGLKRPPRDVALGLVAAGDYVDGPYPATLEGAVRAGYAAVG